MLDFLKKNKLNNEIYLALSLQEQGGEALLLQYNHSLSSVVILSRRTFSYSNSWERLVEDVDEVLYGLEQEAGVKATKSIVFIYSHLVDIEKNEIKEPYFEKIKAVASELGLEMIGFMEYHELLSSYLSMTGSGTLSAVLCEIDTSFVTIFVYRNGHNDLVKTIERTSDYIDTLEKELTQLSITKTLPLRIILYGIGNLEEDMTLFMSKRWPKDVFVQLPKVETLSSAQIDQALVDSFKSQLASSSASDLVVPVVEVQPSQVVERESATGFVVGEDIADMSSSERAPNKEQVEQPLSALNNQLRQEDHAAFVAPGYTVPQKNPNKFFGIPQLRFGRLAPSGLLIVCSGLLLIILALFSLLYFFHKATLTLFYDTKPITTQLTMDAASLSVSSHVATIEATDSIETTGAKFTGEKSHGEVSILNKSKAAVVVAKGTLLTGPNNLKFVLDSEVKIASASEQLTAEGNVLTVTGKEKASITASDIGEEYNLGKDTKFTIQNTSDQVVAQATKSLTGGSKKEVRTASKDDFEKLRKKVAEKIKSQTKETVKADNMKQIIDQLTEVKTTSEKFSKEVAEEASELDLTTRAKVKYYVIPLNKTREMLSLKLKKSIPQDQTLDEQAINFSVKNATINNGKPTLTLSVKGLPRQKIDLTKVKKDLVGRPTSKIEEISKIYQANGYEYQIQTELPFLKSFLPFFSKNLSVTVKTVR